MSPRVGIVLLLAAAALGGSLAAPVSSPREASSPSSAPTDVERTHSYVGTGPLLIPGGHITPVSGKAIISVVDEAFEPIGGAMCHPETDGRPVPCVPTPVTPSRKFCKGLSLHVWPDWDPSRDMWIWLGPPWDQPPGLGVEGVHCEKTRPATIGFVYHWPNEQEP